MHVIPELQQHVQCIAEYALKYVETENHSCICVHLMVRSHPWGITSVGAETQRGVSRFIGQSKM
jgi:hypothetical protein